MSLVTVREERPIAMRKFLFPRVHSPDHDLCIRSIYIAQLFSVKLSIGTIFKRHLMIELGLVMDQPKDHPSRTQLWLKCSVVIHTFKFFPSQVK